MEGGKHAAYICLDYPLHTSVSGMEQPQIIAKRCCFLAISNHICEPWLSLRICILVKYQALESWWYNWALANVGNVGDSVGDNNHWYVAIGESEQDLEDLGSNSCPAMMLGLVVLSQYNIPLISSVSTDAPSPQILLYQKFHPYLLI